MVFRYEREKRDERIKYIVRNYTAPEPEAKQRETGVGNDFTAILFLLYFYLWYNVSMTETEREQNLMIVYAVEGYSQQHKLPEKDVIVLFRENGINSLIRKNYNALHTQGLDESILFAEDVLAWKLT